MNLIWFRIFKSAYRHKPIFSFLTTIGTVNVLLGVFHQHGFLLFLGLNAIAISIALSWWQMQGSKTLQPERVPKYHLLAPSTRRLPLLSISQERPPSPSN